MSWARTPTGERIRVRSTTALLANRERDKDRVESSLGLPEFGDAVTKFYAVRSGMVHIAIGYDRVVYGDHGPYVELSKDHVCWDSFPIRVAKADSFFYDELWTGDGQTMLYEQKRPVKNKANPPPGPWSVQNNRAEGYANYLAGKYYLAAEADTVAVSCIREPRRRRRRRGREGGEDVSEHGERWSYAEWTAGWYEAPWAAHGSAWHESSEMLPRCDPATAWEPHVA